MVENIKWRVEFGKLEREEIPEVPVDAVREALVNSLCHRDYRIPKSNEIAIFKNRIEIYNPGTFPEGLTPQDFIEGRERSVLRNPLIAQTLYLSKDVEKWGSGLKRIYEDCLKNRVSVEFWTLQTGFMVIFYRKYDDKDFSLSGEEVSEYVNRDVNEDAKKVYDYIKKHPGHKAAAISEALAIPLRTAERWIRKLKSEDKIEFIGSKKAGGYYPKKDVILNEEVKEEVNEYIKELYDYIKKHPGHKAASISEALAIPLRTVERWIRKLKSENKIEFIGSKKAGGYYPKEKPTSDG
jgi:ATP-dependent DNA helicase RecG